MGDAFLQARENMVNCQIRTNGVVNAAVLNAFEQTPREIFVGEDLYHVAYTDKPLPLGKERVLMDPMTHARLIEALAPRPHEIALDIGSASGYSAAILSPLVTTVLALETRQPVIDKAMRLLESRGIVNVAYVKGKLSVGSPDQAPFDVIIVNGAVGQVSEAMLGQLSDGGRLAAVERVASDAVGQAVLYTRHSSGACQREVLFESSVPYLSGFLPAQSFVFG